MPVIIIIKTQLSNINIKYSEIYFATICYMVIYYGDYNIDPHFVSMVL